MASSARLVRVAAAVADGTPVDWHLEEGSASAQEVPLLRQLRVVAEIAAVPRSPGPGDSWGPLRLIAALGSGARPSPATRARSRA